MAASNSLIKKILIWRVKNISSNQLMLILSIIVGLWVGLSAVVVKHFVHFIRTFLQHGLSTEYHNYMLVVFPVLGILLVVFFIKYILKKPIQHGIPNVLYAISKNNGIIPGHNTFSSIITSGLTVGFGGSVGLEGPMVLTGGAIGSAIGRVMHLNYKQIILLLGCGSASVLAAVFKAPIAAIVFAIEVIMIDLTTFTLLPLLLASLSAVLTSYFFLGTDVLYPFSICDFKLVQSRIPLYVVLGIFCGLFSMYFSRTYMFFHSVFDRIKNKWHCLLLGSISLGIVIFLFPSLYGEGYESINACLAGDYSYLYNHSLFYQYRNYYWVVAGLGLAVVLFKVVGASLTFGSGGIGGIFAPSLFMGVNVGFLFASVSNKLGFSTLPVSNFALLGMAGIITGVMHAPLTGIFLIAEITGGYQMLLPLMLVATFSYVTVKAFESNSVYTIMLAKRNELITHHKDKAVLSLMKLDKLIETNFVTLSPNDTLEHLVEAISNSNRNLFPVVDGEQNLKGIIYLDSVRKIIFKNELYKSTLISDLMSEVRYSVQVNENMENIASMFQETGLFNLVVLDDSKYVGFVSRANVFSSYRRMQCYLSAD